MSPSSEPPWELPGAHVPPAARPLVVQSDGTLLLDVQAEWAAAARNALAAFAHLERSPEYIHTYRVTPLSLWNAAASGVTVGWIEEALRRLSRYPVPDLVVQSVRDQVSRFGRATLLPHGDGLLRLRVDDPMVRLELARSEDLAPFRACEHGDGFLVRAGDRGLVKQALIKAGYPAEDLCGYVEGVPLPLRLRTLCDGGETPFALRPYQRAAVDTFHHGGGPRGGAGVIVLPCGAGKTVIGIGAIERLGTSTLVLTTNTVAVHQWRDELLDKTDLDPTLVGEYTGAVKEVRPVTITTYQILTHRSRGGELAHLDLMRRNEWGLIIYDEVHTLPAPVFRTTAEIQARRRLGLTATLVREDGREDDVFALIGPKRYDLPWRILERQGYIAEASCHEIRIELPDEQRIAYALARKRDKFRIAAENPRKIRIVEELITNNPDDAILVIGQYIDQLETVARDLSLPLITGKTPNSERERLYQAFREGRERVLVVSKVANFAIDLPDASLAIEISGTFGSRQEEAQRLGRILRPKERSARFYVLVSKDTREQEFAVKRQLFLVEQGYKYRIVTWGE